MTIGETADPATLGIDPDRLSILLARVRAETDGGRLPSAQVAVARHGRLARFDTFGDPGVQGTARYVTQSVGRTAVASAMWKLLGDGAIGLDERVADVIPEFGANGKDVVTVRHVLTHTGGFPFAPLGYPKMADREQRLAAFAKWRLTDTPGQTLQFHLTSAAWLIAEMVERRAGVPLPAYVRREIAGPLGLTLDLGVDLEEQRSTVAAMTRTGGSEGEVDPWGPWYLADPRVVAAGEPAHSVVASAADVALHYQALLAALEGDEGIWSGAAVREAVSPQVVAVPAGDELYGGGTRRTAIGLFVVVAGDDGADMMPTAGSPAAFGNGGAAYQLGFADPESGVSFALLSNGYPPAGYDRSRRGRAFLTNVANLAADLT